MTNKAGLGYNNNKPQMSHVCELSAEDVLLQFGVDFSSGLSPQEVHARQQQHGPNDMGEEDEVSAHDKRLRSLNSPC